MTFVYRTRSSPAIPRPTPQAANRPSDCGALGLQPGSIVSLGNNLFGDPTGCGALLLSDRTGDPGLGSFVDPRTPRHRARAPVGGQPGDRRRRQRRVRRRRSAGLVRPIDGDGDAVRACDIGAVEFYPAVNDLVELDALRSTYVPPSRRDQSNPLTAGGTFEIAAVFTNLGAQDLCHVAFQVIALRGEAGGTPAVVTRRGALIGGEGVTRAGDVRGCERESASTSSGHVSVHHRAESGGSRSRFW